ncbi:MAG: PAS domain S-box protein, partial [Pedobacter sp.]
ALYAYEVLDTPAEPGFDNLARLAAHLFNVPFAFVSLIDKDRLWFKSVVGGPLLETPREGSFDNYAMLQSGVMEVENAILDPRFAENPLICEEPGVRFYAGAPLIDEDGFVLGTLCILDTKPRTLSKNEREMLQTLSGEVLLHLTVRKKSLQLETKTKNFEELLSISAVSPEIHCVLDFNGKILFINEAVTTVLEYSAAEAVGMNMWEVCYPEDIPRLIAAIEDGLRNKRKEFKIDFRIVSKSGVVRWLSWSMVTKNDRWFTYGRDITESKRVENELMRLSFVASKINNGVVINDANNHVTWVNDAFEKITGYNLEDLKGKRLGDLIAGPKTDKALINQARELIKQNQSFTVDILAYRKDKQPIWLSVYNTIVFDDKGKVDMEVEIIIDITDKKGAEEELQVLSLVASKTNTGVNITDKAGKTTWVNQSLEKLTGYSLEDLQGKLLGDIVSHGVEDKELIESSRNRSLNKESYSIEVKATKKDGTPIWLSVANTPVLNAKGEVDRQIDLISDITQRKQVEKEMFDAKEKALQLSDAKEMFLSVMSHEIRTPLNAVIGMTHLLLENDPKPSQVEDLNILKFSGENLLHIINDILDFTKIETGNLELEVIPFSPRVLATDIINSLQVNVSKNSNVLSLVFDDQIPEMVLGDKTRLYQILMNLLGNALKFTDKGKVELILELAQEDDKQISIVFHVKDTGIGIPEDKQSYIFETFTQAKTDISRKYGGTGLGLAITKKLLQLYKSDIQVHSVEGKGTTFSFPITFMKLSDEQQKNRAGLTKTTFNGKKILVVDDNEINILIARRILSKWNLEIDSASNGHEAINKITTVNYDLVFMDIKMPGIDGFETTIIVRELDGNYYKNLPIIALTASTLHNDFDKFEASGMNGHLLKPFNPEEIKKVLVTFLSEK